MTTFLSREVQAGLEAAQRASAKKKSRLRVHAGDDIYPILNFGQSTFSVDATDVPQLRGFVDIFDGGRHLYQALVITSRDEDGARVYEFKRNTIAATAPARDFYVDAEAPAALLPVH